MSKLSRCSAGPATLRALLLSASLVSSTASCAALIPAKLQGMRVNGNVQVNQVPDNLYRAELAASIRQFDIQRKFFADVLRLFDAAVAADGADPQFRQWREATGAALRAHSGQPLSISRQHAPQLKRLQRESLYTRVSLLNAYRGDVNEFVAAIHKLVAGAIDTLPLGLADAEVQLVEQDVAHALDAARDSKGLVSIGLNQVARRYLEQYAKDGLYCDGRDAIALASERQQLRGELREMRDTWPRTLSVDYHPDSAATGAITRFHDDILAIDREAHISARQEMTRGRYCLKLRLRELRLEAGHGLLLLVLLLPVEM